jgi:hypothetical protein
MTRPPFVELRVGCSRLTPSKRSAVAVSSRSVHRDDRVTRRDLRTIGAKRSVGAATRLWWARLAHFSNGLVPLPRTVAICQ